MNKEKSPTSNASFADAPFSIICTLIIKIKSQYFLKLLFFILLFTISKLSHAQDQIEKLIIPKISDEIKLDGIIDEAGWKQAKQFELVQNQPNFENLPTLKTEIYVGYTEDYLYAVCNCYDKTYSSFIKKRVINVCAILPGMGMASTLFIMKIKYTLTKGCARPAAESE